MTPFLTHFIILGNHHKTAESSSAVGFVVGLFSLGLGKNLSVHDRRRGDAPGHGVNLEQSTHA